MPMAMAISPTTPSAIPGSDRFRGPGRRHADMPVLIDDLLVVGGSKATMGRMKVNPQGATPRRISWREILRD